MVDEGVVPSEDVVVIRVGEFVEGDVWHSACFLFEVVDADEFDGFGEFGVKSVFEKPLR